MQIFVKSPNQWRAKPLTEETIRAFKEAREAAPQPVVAHAAYLINLASTDEAALKRSQAALLDELQRCSELGVDALVVHPGAHLGAGVEEGVKRVAQSVTTVLAADESVTTRLLLENTAGQGTTLGSSFAELKGMLDAVRRPERLGVCLDSCHAFAAGYDLSTNEGYDATFEEFSDLIGLEALGCVHLNDSKHPLGSRRDRHANIGEGEIGLPFFARVIQDPALAGLPMILETPLNDDGDGHKVDLARLRGLLTSGPL